MRLSYLGSQNSCVPIEKHETKERVSIVIHQAYSIAWEPTVLKVLDLSLE